MLDTLSDAAAILETIAERDGRYWQLCEGYGEPGYGPVTGDVLVVLGDYWCRCERIGTPYRDGSHLHGIDAHYPAIFARLESLGVSLEWHDEWTDVDGRAYRTSGDSFDWQPSAILTEDCEWVTVDDDFSEIVAWALDDPSRAIPANFGTPDDLAAAGFEQYEHPGDAPYEAGWHPGQTDDPFAIADAAREALGDDTEIVFYLDESSQFYVRFTCWTRPPSDD
jgi:hypothetical protein